MDTVGMALLTFVAVFGGVILGMAVMWLYGTRELLLNDPVIKAMLDRLDTLERTVGGKPYAPYRFHIDPVSGRAGMGKEMCPHGYDWDDCPECRR